MSLSQMTDDVWEWQLWAIFQKKLSSEFWATKTTFEYGVVYPDTLNKI